MIEIELYRKGQLLSQLQFDSNMKEILRDDKMNYLKDLTPELLLCPPGVMPCPPLTPADIALKKLVEPV